MWHWETTIRSCHYSLKSPLNTVKLISNLCIVVQSRRTLDFTELFVIFADLLRDHCLSFPQTASYLNDDSTIVIEMLRFYRIAACCNNDGCQI